MRNWRCTTGIISSPCLLAADEIDALRAEAEALRRAGEDHYQQSLKKQEYGVPDRDALTFLAGQGGIEAPVGPAGTVTLFDCNVMHGSSGNITPFPRSNVFLVSHAADRHRLRPVRGGRDRALTTCAKPSHRRG